MKKKQSELKNCYYLIVLSLIILSLILIIIAEKLPSDLVLYKTIINTIGTTLFISGGFGLLDQFVLKEKLIEMILEKLKLKEEIDKTGIENIFYDINDIDYVYYIKKAKNNIDIVHVYGMSWTTKYIDTLKEKVLNSNCDIRVVLLSPNSLLVPGLAEHFNYTENELRNKIIEVSKIWGEINNEKNKQKKRKTQSNLALYYHRGNPAYSLYRIDDTIIHVSNKLIKGRTTKLPSMVLRRTNNNSDLFNINLMQIENLIKESEEIDLEKILNNGG